MPPSPESLLIRFHIRKETAPSEVPLSVQRQEWIEYAETLPLHAEVDVQEDTIAGVRCLWLCRRAYRSDTTILYLHGGGLVDGAIVTHREFVSRLVGTTGHRALMVEYRLMPEHRFPAALDDVLAVYHALESVHGIRPKGIVLGGDSSGGGLAVAAMMRLSADGREMPACAFTISGSFDLTLASESMTGRDHDDPCLSYAALQGWLRYFEGFDLTTGELSPLHGDARGLPPILLQVGDHEVWRDDSTRMAAKIRDAGGVAELSIWAGMWHVWPMWSKLPEAHGAIEEIGEFIRRQTGGITRLPSDFR